MPDSSKEEKSPVTLLREVRYSLRDMLREVELERDGSSIGQEIVDQSEINKLFRKDKNDARGNPGK